MTKNRPQNIKISNKWVIQNLNIQCCSFDKQSPKENFDLLRDVKWTWAEPANITLVIGGDYPELTQFRPFFFFFFFFLLCKTNDWFFIWNATLGWNGCDTYAVQTKFGWLLIGGSKLNLKPSTESSNLDWPIILLVHRTFRNTS